MKRILTLFLLIFIIFILFSCNNDFDKNPFYEDDNLRNCSILGLRDINERKLFSNPYIVSFNDNVPLEIINSIVNDYNYELLANSSQRVFLIDVDNISSFEKEYSQFINSIQKDISNRYSLTINDIEPSYSTSYSHNFDGFQEYYQSSDLIIAVLDSGVNREHVALQGANILPGFDSVSQSIGVNTDSIGHGTSIIGMLAAVKGNETGVVGLLNNPTILPIKVTDDNGDISSSDFIRAIYYAVDSGAKIINMSFCGSEYIEAEQQAINYAFENGCILVSASGNFSSNSQYQNFVTYPSCYDHVIGVSSINKEGILSNFSFFNDNVDIAALGEQIKIISGVTNKAVIVADGTSFSTPFITALSSVVLSNLDEGISINCDEMSVLIRRNSSLFNGIRCFEPIKTIDDCNNPIICGIENGKTYFENVVVSFNHGKVLLDGKEIENNTKINFNGFHQLVVVYNEYLVQYTFSIDNIPLEFDCPEGDEFHESISISFDRGTATLNGEPYFSGKPIEQSGYYYFVLTGPYGNKVEKTFSIHLELPEVIGISNNETYFSNTSFKVVGHGYAYLNGKEIKIGEQVVCDENGDYILVITNLSGSSKIEYKFSIFKDVTPSFPVDIDDCELFVDEIYGNVYITSNEISGIRIYSLDNLSELKKVFLADGQVLGFVSVGDYLYCWTSDKLYSIPRKDIINNDLSVIVLSFNEIKDVATNGEHLFITGNEHLYILNVDSNEIVDEVSLSESKDNLLYFKPLNSFILFNNDSFEIDIYSLDDKIISKLILNNKIDFLISDGEFLYSNGVIYDSNLSIHSFVKSFSPKYFIDGYLVSEDLIYNVEKSLFEASLNNRILYLFKTDNAFYVYHYGAIFNVYQNKNNIIETLNASIIVEDKIFDFISKTSFSSTIKLNSNISIHQWIYNYNLDKIFFISENSNILYAISHDLQSFERFYLKDIPSYIFTYEDKVFVFFKTLKEIYCLDTTSSYYRNIDFELSVDMFTGKGKFFALSGGIVYNVFDDFSVEIFVDRDDIISIGYSEYLDCLFASTIGGKLIKFDILTGEIISEISCPSTYKPLICRENSIIVGNVIVDGSSMISVGNFSTNVFDINSTYILLNKELFNINNSTTTTISSDFIFGFLDDDNVYCYTKNNQIIRYHNSFNVEAGVLPKVNIEGEVINNTDNIYIGDVKIFYDIGYGYIDGHPFNSGDIIDSGGDHRITIVLPYGQSYECYFSIDTSIKSIVISGPNKVNVNDSIKLSASVFPIGAKEEDIIFTSLSENIIISDDGLILGIREGIAEIVCSTVDGRVVASYVVEVMPFLFEVSNERFKVDLDNKYLLDIPCYMRVSELLRFIKYNYGTARVVDLENNIVGNNGYLSSGMILEILNPVSEVIYSLQIALDGDIDGDGYVLIGDFILIGKHIYKTELLDGYHLASADVTNDGKVNISDLLKISSHLLNKNRLYDNDDYSLEDKDSSFVFYDTDKPLKGESFKTMISYSNSSAQAIKGRLKYDSSILSFVDFSSLTYGWRVDIYENEGYIDFLVYNPMFDTSSNFNGVSLTINFFVNENIDSDKDTVIEIVDVSSELGVASDSQNLIHINNNSDSTLLSSIVLNNGNIPINFKKSILKYWVAVPYSIDYIEIGWDQFDSSANVTVVNNPLLVGTNTLKLIVEKDNESSEYVIYVVRYDEDKLSSESRAKEIKSNIGIITPKFAPDLYFYDITLDNDAQISFFVDLFDENASYSVKEIENGYIVQCVAENGEITEYRFDKKIIYDISQSEQIIKVDKYWTIVFILITFALGGIVSMLLLIKRNKRD